METTWKLRKSEPRTLYVDAGADSEQAKVALQEADLECQTVFLEEKDVERDKQEGKHLPRLITMQGFFDDLESIQWYTRVYGKDGPRGFTGETHDRQLDR
ncbi:MAG: hypothetical protein AAB407_03590 [Patescibacteria group bacterium]